MSLQLVANHLAQKGRGPDSTLVHMTPGEVASLQSLAQQHGGSLSINPQTGLPEAGFLSALLPMAAGAGLAAMGMPSGYAALAVGATSAATNGGNMREAMKDGFLAYSGAGVADSFMGAGAAMQSGAATSATAPTVLETSAGATSPYALTGSSTAPSTAGYSLGESSSFLNKPLPTLASAAPAEVAQAAAAATPAAQQAAALESMDMSQRFDALKAGASGSNAMKYIKANPFTSLGVASIAMTPDENKTPQKATDSDRGPRAGLNYYPNWSNPTPKPNMQGIEQTYNRPYYAAEGGVTHMAEGGSTGGKDYDGVAMSPAIRELLAQHDRSLREIQRLKAQQVGAPPAPLDQKQLFADYLKRVAGGTGAGTGTGIEVAPKPGTGVETETPKVELPFLETPVASNTRGGGGGGRGSDSEGPSAWSQMTPEERAAYYAEHPTEGKLALLGQDALGYTTLGLLAKAVGKDKWYDSRLEKMGVNPTISLEKQNQIAGTAMQKALDSQAATQAQQQAITEANKTSTVFGGYPNGAPNPYSMGPGTPGFNAVPTGPTRGAFLPTPLGTNAAPTDGGAPPSGGGGGGNKSSDGGNGGGYSGAPSAGSDVGRSPPGSAHTDAQGGYLQHGKFDQRMAQGGLSDPYDLGSYSDGGRLLKGPGDGVSDSIPATIGKGRPARLADGEFVIPARIVSEIGNGSTDAGARKLYAMMDRIQAGRKKSVGKNKVAVNSRADKHLPA